MKLSREWEDQDSAGPAVLDIVVSADEDEDWEERVWKDADPDDDDWDDDEDDWDDEDEEEDEDDEDEDWDEDDEDDWDDEEDDDV